MKIKEIKIECELDDDAMIYFTKAVEYAIYTEFENNYNIPVGGLVDYESDAEKGIYHELVRIFSVNKKDGTITFYAYHKEIHSYKRIKSKIRDKSLIKKILK